MTMIARTMIAVALVVSPTRFSCIYGLPLSNALQAYYGFARTATGFLTRREDPRLDWRGATIPLSAPSSLGPPKSSFRVLARKNGGRATDIGRPPTLTVLTTPRSLSSGSRSMSSRELTLAQGTSSPRRASRDDVDLDSIASWTILFTSALADILAG